MRCLLVNPKIEHDGTSLTKADAKRRGAKAPSPSLGLLTLAALLPKDWEIKFIDCVIQELKHEEIEWAEWVMIGGMSSQKRHLVELIDFFKTKGKTVIVGGSAPTADHSPYLRADHLVLGEAEMTLPGFLKDYANQKAKKIYFQGEKKADLSLTPVPRYDLIKLSDYHSLYLQATRGCPFRCDFCDVIVNLGHLTRIKPIDHFLRELESIYQLGYRGHILLADDNFIGNKKFIRPFLSEMARWQKERHWPFRFWVSASLNLATDPKIIDSMLAAGFDSVFMGIETADSDVLRSINKKQNTLSSVEATVEIIQKAGLRVSAGFIFGMDGEKEDVTKGTFDLIQKASISNAYLSLLQVLPGTALEKRLAKEGRLESPPLLFIDGKVAEFSCLNFKTQRPKNEIFIGLIEIAKKLFSPAAYFDRAATQLSIIGFNRHILPPSQGPLFHIKFFVLTLNHIWNRPTILWHFGRGYFKLIAARRSRFLLEYFQTLMNYFAYEEMVLKRFHKTAAVELRVPGSTEEAFVGTNAALAEAASQ